jgi:hypothetical protein
MLIAAAAQRWGSSPPSVAQERPASSMRTANLELRRARRGRRQAAAAEGRQAQAREPSFQLIGKSIARIDTPGKVDGSAEFGIDVKAAGHAVCRARAAPVLGGKVSRVDSSRRRAAARRTPGALDAERRRGRRRAFLAGAASARGAEDRLGSGRQRAARQCRDPRTLHKALAAARARRRAPMAMRRPRSRRRIKP